jgi:cation:H+ antiporter
LIIAVALLLLGFAVLYFGAEWLVSGAAEIANHLRLSRSFVGLTLVAVGTSAPELVVNLIAASRGHSDFALANVAGSNLTNICLGFGVSAMFVVFAVRRNAFLLDLVYLVLAPCLVLGSFLCTAERSLSMWTLLPFGILLLGYLVSLARRRHALVRQQPRHPTVFVPLVLFLLGVVVLYGGGELVVQNALWLSHSLRIDETIIGLTVVAAGTSVPDVVATITAIRRKEYEIGVGNILGSNISNVLLVLGGTLVVAGKPLPADLGLLADFTAVCVVSLAFAVGAAMFQRVRGPAGIALVLAFVAYFGARVGIAVWG